MNITTWNMQGGNASTDIKWQTGVLNAFQSQEQWKPDLMCLQECGGIPNSAQPVTVVAAGAHPPGTQQTIEIYTYGGTRSRPAYFIVYHHWDTGANRVNTAIIGRGPNVPGAGDVTLAWPASGPTWRPALGLRIGGGWVFSFHAISPGGPDAAPMLAAIAAGAGTAPWIVAADWNREPNTLVLPPNSVVCPPNGPTHPVNAPASSYDYIVRSGTGVQSGQRLSLICSDHHPVAYVF